MRVFFRLLAVSTAVLFAASSCEKPASVLKYILDGDFEYAATVPMSEYPDSLFNAPYIRMDDNSYLGSDYSLETGTLRRGWTLSFKKGLETEKGGLSPFSSGGSEAGAGPSKAYVVFYDGQSSLEYNDLFFTCTNVISYNCLFGGFLVNNSGSVLDFIENNPPKEGDYMKVVVTAFRNGKEVGTAEKLLVDFTEEKLKVVTDWEVFKFDIKESADAADFHIQTNIDGIPPYFCLDNFVASLDLEY